MGASGWKGQTRTFRGSPLLYLLKHIKVDSGNIGEDVYTETLHVNENLYHSPHWNKQLTKCDLTVFAMKTQCCISLKYKRNTRRRFTKDKHHTSVVGWELNALAASNFTVHLCIHIFMLFCIKYVRVPGGSILRVRHKTHSKARPVNRI